MKSQFSQLLFVICLLAMCCFGACDGDDGPAGPVVTQGCAITQVDISFEISFEYTIRTVVNYNGSLPSEILAYHNGIGPEHLTQRMDLSYENALLAGVMIYNGNNELTGETEYTYEQGRLTVHQGTFANNVSSITWYFYDSNLRLARAEDEVSENGTVVDDYAQEYTYDDQGALLTALYEDHLVSELSRYESTQDINPLAGSPFLHLLTPILDFNDFFLSSRLISNEKVWFEEEVIREFDYEYTLNGLGYPESISRTTVLSPRPNEDPDVQVDFSYSCAN